MKFIIALLCSLTVLTAHSQPCPEISSEATESYSVTFMKSDIAVLRDRWERLNLAIKNCEQSRGKTVSLKDEIGESFYSRLQSPDQVIDTKERNISEQKKQQAMGKGIIVNSYIFKQLTVEDQRKLVQKYPLMDVTDENIVGRINSYQVVNNSIDGDNSGSKLGSLLGQSTYIDGSATSRSYSATGQVGAGIVGALIGGNFNKEAQRRFTITYGVQLIDSSIKTLSLTSSNESASPVGQCVYFESMKEAPYNLCVDSLVAYLGRVKIFAANITGPSLTVAGSIERVRCKVEGLGELSVPRDDCINLKGNELN